MNQQDFGNYANFLFSACKMESIDIMSQDYVVLDIYCQKLHELQEKGRLQNHIRAMIRSMLSIKMSIGQNELEEFWRPLFEILALALE